MLHPAHWSSELGQTDGYRPPDAAGPRVLGAGQYFTQCQALPRGSVGAGAGLGAAIAPASTASPLHPCPGHPPLETAGLGGGTEGGRAQAGHAVRPGLRGRPGMAALRLAARAWPAGLGLAATLAAGGVRVAGCEADVRTQFDPEALERGAAALREINKSPYAKKARPRADRSPWAAARFVRHLSALKWHIVCRNAELPG